MRGRWILFRFTLFLLEIISYLVIPLFHTMLYEPLQSNQRFYGNFQGGIDGLNAQIEEGMGGIGIGLPDRYLMGVVLPLQTESE